MRDYWSISGLAAEFRLDRRTVARDLDVGDVQPAPEKGPKGHTLYRLRDAVNAFADNNRLGTSTETWRERCSDGGRESGAREMSEAVVNALAKRLDRPALRVVLEVLVAELHTLIGVIYGRMSDGEEFHGAALPWAELSDAELEAALRSLIDEGYLPSDDEEAGAA